MLRISVWNIAFTIINILVLFFFMRHFLMKPVMEILEERKKLVEKDLDEADRSKIQEAELKEMNRKIKGILDMTPNDYIRLERLKKAAQLLKEGECKINEVCYMTGFNTPSYFTKCFQKQFGILPKDFVK